MLAVIGSLTIGSTLTRSPKIDRLVHVLIEYNADARKFQVLVSLISRKNRVSGSIDATDGIWNLTELDLNLKGLGDDPLTVYATTCLCNLT
jgi:hypothetical protein